eukprot:12254012-Alexandrium_andersonii.AAC.1
MVTARAEGGACKSERAANEVGAFDNSWRAVAGQLANPLGGLWTQKGEHSQRQSQQSENSTFHRSEHLA